ncbi:SIMPL domain-containing protein [Candidatus Poribacteria bacterium]|nr:MAG: SIMPL domain-containing protein [Candidatus Poribacteria bacterium]
MNKFKCLFLSFGSLLVILLAGCEQQIVSPLFPAPESRSIHVNGSGSVTGEPDIATLYLGVSVEKETVEAAREAAASAMTAVIDALKANDIAENDIQTENFSIYPQYDWTDEGRVLRGYRVNNSVRAKVRDLETLSDIIDDATRAGGDIIVVDSIQFMIEDPTPLQAQARVLAVKDAKVKAQTLAEASGVTLGKPITISETTRTTGPPIAYAETAEFAADDGARSATPIQAGELTVTINVTLVYEIE